MRLSITTFLFLIIFSSVSAQNKVELNNSSNQADRMEWWTEARFGMFIHWGLYALPARHEWVMSNEKMPKNEYEKYMEYFNPDLYNPKEWARLAKNAGMKYVVFTAKHHDGFSMFDSKFTDIR